MTNLGRLGILKIFMVCSWFICSLVKHSIA
uniref:Uncharacterized protein n=1 Tax=Podoviridae sp. ct53O25 TaxID=2826539 RepID=A0A8S5MBS5_9CAUD|nr:MAG TPA: hypothetical protein [Podoviridae sp. ct53O25]